MQDTKTAQEIELEHLNAARKLLIRAMSNIDGTGPDWQKAMHILNYLDSKRNPIMAAMLAPDMDVAA